VHKSRVGAGAAAGVDAKEREMQKQNKKRIVAQLLLLLLEKSV